MMKISQMKYNGSEAWKTWGFQATAWEEQHSWSRLMEEKRAKQGPAQAEVHRPEQGIGNLLVVLRSNDLWFTFFKKHFWTMYKTDYREDKKKGDWLGSPCMRIGDGIIYQGSQWDGIRIQLWDIFWKLQRLADGLDIGDVKDKSRMTPSFSAWEAG